jgi:aminopeptidase
MSDFIEAGVFRTCLQRYARLIAEHGVHVQPGQLVNVSSEVYHRDFVALVVEELYARGAKYVHVELSDPLLSRTRILKSRAEYLEETPAFFAAKYRELVESSAANLKILGPEMPDHLADLDPKAVNRVRKGAYSAAKHFYTEGIEKSKVHWCVVAAATPAWAQKIFPGVDGRDAELRLWKEIFSICRVDREDFLSVWDRHNDVLHRRATALTELGIEELHFKGPGTDLRVGLSSRALFKGGADRTPSGTSFEPNIPTEECFTTPDWRRTEGTVAATRPFYVNGCLVKGLSISFKNGEISQFSCEEGEATFRAYIESDEGAKRLGEVALVGTDSPVFKSGLVFQEILYDENAACHIALGSAYRGCLKGGAALSDQECEGLGCNASSVHTDIMISSEVVDVDARLRSGETLRLIEHGAWFGSFAPR